MRWLLAIVVVALLGGAVPSAAMDVPLPVVRPDGTIVYYLVPLDEVSAFLVDQQGNHVGRIEVPSSPYAAPAGPPAGGMYMKSDLPGIPDSAMPIMPTVPGYPNAWD